MEETTNIFVTNDKWSMKHIARHIIKEIKQPYTFVMFDVADLLKKYENWVTKMPRIQPFYAVKCNYNRVVLEVLAALGAGFDCASETEINLALSTGVPRDRIVFAHTTKHHEHIIHAKNVGVDLLTFDSEFELLKIKQYHPHSRLLMRIRNDAKVVVNPLGQKFGCCPHKEAFQLLFTAKKLGLKVVGVSFHVGSGCGEIKAYGRGIAEAHRLFEQARKLGHDMDLLDIGGGYPGDLNTTIDDMAAEINRALDKYFPIGCGVKIIAEPGRYFVASAFTLACCVHSARRLTRNNQSHTMYFLDNGLYGSFAGITSNRLVIEPYVLDLEDDELISCSLWGPTCDGVDMIAKHVMLPKLPLPSWLLFHSFGAYTSTTSTEFNGFDKAKEYIFASEKTWNVLNEIDCSQTDRKITAIWLPERPPLPLSVSGLNFSHIYKSPLAKMKLDRKESCNGLITPSRFKRPLSKRDLTPKKSHLSPSSFCSPRSSFSTLLSPNSIFAK